MIAKLTLVASLWIQASSVYATDLNTEYLRSLEAQNIELSDQKASGCRTECTYSEAFRRTTCQEVCDQPVAGMCERTAANVFVLGCLAGGVIGGLLGLGMGSGMSSAVTYGLGGCVLMGGGVYLLKSTSNCPN